MSAEPRGKWLMTNLDANREAAQLSESQKLAFGSRRLGVIQIREIDKDLNKRLCDQFVHRKKYIPVFKEKKQRRKCTCICDLENRHCLYL